MLHVAEAFIDKNYHPAVICRAYNKALEDAVFVLDKIALTVDVKDRSTMLGLVKSCIGTKFTSQFGDLIAFGGSIGNQYYNQAHYGHVRYEKYLSCTCDTFFRQSFEVFSG